MMLRMVINMVWGKQHFLNEVGVSSSCITHVIMSVWNYTVLSNRTDAQTELISGEVSTDPQ